MRRHLLVPTTVLVATSLSLLAQTTLATPAAHAQTLPTAVRYTLPLSLLRGTPTVYYSHRYGDGSVSYLYKVTDVAAHPGVALYYRLNTHNPSAADARAYSESARTAEAQPATGGVVHTYRSGSAWAAMETGTDEDGAQQLRLSMGGALHRVAFVVTVDAPGDDAEWALSYTAGVTKALITRIP